MEDPESLGFKVKGRKIATDIEPPLNVVYLARVVDPAQWDSLFVDALIAKLAMEWSEPCAKEARLVKAITEDFNRKIQTAFGVDGAEGSTEMLPVWSWADANR